MAASPAPDSVGPFPKKETHSRQNNRNQQQTQHLYFNSEKTEIDKVSSACPSYTLVRESQVFPKVLFRHVLEGLGNQAYLSLTRLCWHGIVSWSLLHEPDSGSVGGMFFSPAIKGPHYCTTYFIEQAYLGLLQVGMRTENPSPLPCW